MNVTEISGLSLNENELRVATERLCMFGASGSGEYVRELQEFITLHAMAFLDPGFRPFQLIYSKVRELVNFPWEFDDILQALSRLSKKGEIEFRGVMANPESEYRMKVETISRLRTQVKDQDCFEKTILEQWSDELIQRYPDLSKNDIDNIIADLKSYILRILGQHAVESLSLYYGNDQDITLLVEKFSAETINEILPACEERLKHVRTLELPKFFKDASLSRKQYIAGKMNSVFILHLLQLDPTCASLAKSQIPGGDLYLDTNFIYRLVGLQGELLCNAAKHLKDMSHTLGYRMVVTPRTIIEYKKSINNSMRKVRQVPAITPQLATVALQITDDADMLTAYWKRIESTGLHIDPRVFYEYYLEIESILIELGIDIVENDAYRYVLQHDPAIAREETILENAASQIGRYIRHPDITNHDAFHRLLILQLRSGDQNSSFAETRHWFLTCDSKLPRYDRVARSGTDLIMPFCVLVSQWLQAIRPLMASDEGSEITLVESLDSTYLRIYKSPPSELLNEIMSRFAMSPNYDSQVAAKMFLNHQFMEQFERASTEEQKDKIIDEFYAKYIESLESDVRTANKRIQELESLVQSLPLKTTGQTQYAVYTNHASFENAIQSKKEITMGDQNTFSNISGSNINVDSMLEQVGQNISNIQVANQATKEEISTLVAQLADILKGAPTEKKEEAGKIADRVDTLIKEAIKEKPDKEKVGFNLESLKKAAENIAGVLPTVLPIAMKFAEHIHKLIG